MGLLKKIIENKLWFRDKSFRNEIAKRAAVAAMATSITISSFFGLSGCNIKQESVKAEESITQEQVPTTENQKLILYPLRLQSKLPP